MKDAKIFIVEDERQINEFLELMSNRKSFAVAAAGRAEKASEIFDVFNLDAARQVVRERHREAADDEVIEKDRFDRGLLQNERLEQEVEIGAKIQEILLKGDPPAGLKGVSLAVSSVSSQKIDGDFYDFFEHAEDCFDLLIGDVMGKGIPAALVGAATKNSFLRALGQLQADEQKFRPSAEKIVARVNREVTHKLMRLESFVTACYARFDLTNRELTFVDCGHTKTIHYRPQTGKTEILEGDNMPLGFSEGEIFTEKTVRFETGDILFFFSDGATETRNSKGELFGEQRLAEFIRHNALLEPAQLNARLLETLKEFAQAKTLDDDLTCIVARIDRHPLQKSERPAKRDQNLSAQPDTPERNLLLKN